MGASHRTLTGADTASLAFRALGDPTRRRILKLLAERDMTIGEIVDRFEMTRAGVKKHLNVLQQGQLIRVTARGRERRNALDPAGLKAVSHWIGFFDTFWDEKLASLKAAAEKDRSHD